MKRVWYVARRELVSTVLTKGFIVGILLTPCLVALILVLMPALMSESAPPIEGRLLVRDPSGLVYPGIVHYLDPATLAGKRSELVDGAAGVMPTGVGAVAVHAVLGEVPELEVALIPESPDPIPDPMEEAKRSLMTRSNLLAIVVVPADVIDAQRGSYELFVREKLDDRLERELHAAIRDAIVDARVDARGLNRAELDALIRVPYRRSTTVTDEGERETFEMLGVVLPLAFTAMVLMSVLVSAQYLVTTTIEEKQSRVVEMLLSAVSPTELMTGKILGQLGVGLLVLGLYSGAGLVGLSAFSMTGAIEAGLIAYVLLSYFIAYFVIASLMAAIGAAVNELREAQTLLTPFMVILLAPWLLWLPISRNPDSTLAVVTSFVPPVNTFAMLLRMTSNSPPPFWQVALSLAVGVASVGAAFWFAGKVFRVGLLMHGKPPNVRTLIRWARTG
jgi:ABC-2 type transport system permease protein